MHTVVVRIFANMSRCDIFMANFCTVHILCMHAVAAYVNKFLWKTPDRKFSNYEIRLFVTLADLLRRFPLPNINFHEKKNFKQKISENFREFFLPQIGCGTTIAKKIWEKNFTENFWKFFYWNFYFREILYSTYSMYAFFSQILRVPSCTGFFGPYTICFDGYIIWTLTPSSTLCHVLSIYVVHM
jgi:hypothetical protein